MPVEGPKDELAALCELFCDSKVRGPAGSWRWASRWPRSRGWWTAAHVPHRVPALQMRGALEEGLQGMWTEPPAHTGFRDGSVARVTCSNPFLGPAQWVPQPHPFLMRQKARPTDLPQTPCQKKQSARYSNPGLRDTNGRHCSSLCRSSIYSTEQQAHPMLRL